MTLCVRCHEDRMAHEHHRDVCDRSCRHCRDFVPMPVARFQAAPAIFPQWLSLLCLNLAQAGWGERLYPYKEPTRWNQLEVD